MIVVSLLTKLSQCLLVTVVILNTLLMEMSFESYTDF